MLNVQQATSIANDYLVGLLGQDAVSGVRLEEVELVERGNFVDDETPDEVKVEDVDEWDKSYWLITVSYLPNSLNPIISESRQRQYKVFKIEAETGRFVAMKIRQVA